MENYINVNLYGDGSRKVHLRAEYIYCEHCNECSLYKEGKCFNVTTPFGSYCSLGRVSKVDYGTKQSRKFYEADAKVRNDKKYHALEYPSKNNIYLYTVGDKICLTLPYAHIKYNEETDEFSIDDRSSFFNSAFVAIPLDKFTNERIYKICKAQPRTLFDYTVIKDYAEKVVPEFIIQLKSSLPEKYEEFIDEHPEYRKDFKDINFVGKTAYLSTCSKDPNIIYKDTLGNNFHFLNDKTLVCEEYRSAFLPFNGSGTRMDLRLTEKMTYKITDNNQVLETTKFV